VTLYLQCYSVLTLSVSNWTIRQCEK